MAQRKYIKNDKDGKRMNDDDRGFNKKNFKKIDTNRTTNIDKWWSCLIYFIRVYHMCVCDFCWRHILWTTLFVEGYPGSTTECRALTPPPYFQGGWNLCVCVVFCFCVLYGFYPFFEGISYWFHGIYHDGGRKKTGMDRWSWRDNSWMAN